MSDSPVPPHMRELLLLGLQHTGKTTFLALFYLALTKRRITTLQLAEWSGDFEYLNQIAQDLMSGTEADHTPHDEHRRELDMLMETGDGAVFGMRIPDLSGERWRDALIHRRWDADIDGLVTSAAAKLLFVHPDDIVRGVTINEVHAAAQSLGAQDDPQPADGIHGGLPGQAPTQVQLVDLIQLTCEQRGPRPARLCLVVSAWDKVRGTPGDFVAESMPLLQQYLDTNAGWLDWQVFGVSAQGGRFDDENSRKQLLAADPVDRSIIETADSTQAHIGDVVEWALGIS